MRRIKSAPANICMMCHNKITNKNISEKKNVLLDTSSEIKIADIKTKKQAITTSSNIISDAITNSNLLSFEENYLIGYNILTETSSITVELSDGYTSNFNSNASLFEMSIYPE